MTTAVDAGAPGTEDEGAGQAARPRLRWERVDGTRVPVVSIIVRTDAEASPAAAATELATVRRHVAAVVGDGAVAVRILLST